MRAVKFGATRIGVLIGLREDGFSFLDTAERLGRNVSTVHDCWQQWSRDGAASRRPGSGQPRGTTDGGASMAEIRAAVDITVTQRTVRNRLLQG
ncbi:HTH_Tnp_Tc3_2 domain-containing protein [Trichonephila clavipes]|nr:HTH_Tnp_Tc3_2 domain-containing protein [Trichonephila clavipes]